MPGPSILRSSELSASDLGESVKLLAEELDTCDKTVSQNSQFHDLCPQIASGIVQGIEKGLAEALASGKLRNFLSLEDQQIIRDCILCYVKPQLKIAVDAPLGSDVSTYPGSSPTGL